MPQFDCGYHGDGVDSSGYYLSLGNLTKDSLCWLSYTFKLMVEPDGGCARRLLLPTDPVPVLTDSE